MSNQAWDPKWGLVILATAADAFGVAGYLGIQASWSIRVGIAIFFFIVAVISASFTLRAELSLLLSPRGSYYASSFHVKRTITGFIAVAAAVMLASTSLSPFCIRHMAA